MNKKKIHQNMLQAAMTLAGTNMTRWAVTLTVVISCMFALPTGVWAQKTEPNPNDINRDGVVNAADVVKAIAAGKTQAEIDAIVNAIMSMSKEFDPTTTPLTFEAAVANTVVTFQLTGTLEDKIISIFIQRFMF